MSSIRDGFLNVKGVNDDKKEFGGPRAIWDFYYNNGRKLLGE